MEVRSRSVKNAEKWQAKKKGWGGQSVKGVGRCDLTVGLYK
jgi:hypothetical protein